MFFSSASEDRRLCRCKCVRPHLAARLTQNRICCREHRFVVIISKPTKEATNSAKRLTQKQVGGGVIKWRRVSISAGELKLGILAAEHTCRGKKVHGRAGNPFLNKLHVEDWLAINDQRPINGKVETPDQATKLSRMPAKLLALHRHIRNTNSRSKPIHPCSPCFAHPIPGWLHHCIVNFLELHSRPAHANRRDKRSQHFVAAFTDLVDSRIAQHSLQRKIDKVSRAAINLKNVVDHFPKPLSREDFEHGSLNHVIFQPTVNKRRSDSGHRFHRVGVCRHACDLLLTRSNSPSVLLNCLRVFAWSTASCRHVLAAPVQQAPNVVRPKSSTVNATFSPLPIGPRIFSLGTLTSRSANRPVAVPRIPSFGMRASSNVKRGMSGVMRNAVTAVLSDPGMGVRAITVSTCAIPAFVMV